MGKNNISSEFYAWINSLSIAPSKEARICLSCTEKKCRGDCEKRREEAKKIKEAKNK